MGKMSVLVVDDEPINLATVATLLEQKYDVRVAKEGIKAIEICHKERVDLILLDIVMPVIDGFEVAKRLKNDPATRSIPIIFLTAMTNSDIVVQGFRAGAVDFVPKPFHEEELSARVANHLELHRLRTQLACELEESERRLTLIDQYVILTKTDLQGVITHVSRAFCRLVGYKCDELVGQTHRVIHSGQTPKEIFVSLWESITLDQTWKGEVINRGKEGELFWFEVTITPEYDQDEKVGYVAFYENITDKKVAQHQAHVDFLTQLFNRNYADRFIRTEVERSRRYATPFSLIMIDIDHFKSINDTYGHPVGDTVLVELSTLLKERVRSSDVVVRFGGEEFMILSPQTTSSQAQELASHLRSEVAQNLFSGVGHLTASFGVTQFGVDDNVESFLKRGDDALYRSKREGRDRVSLA